MKTKSILSVFKQLMVVSLCSLFIFTSCEKTPSPLPEFEEYDVIIVNQGNYSQANGSISLCNSESKEVTNNVFSNANDGRQLSSIIESGVIANNLFLIVCNSVDKIEIVNVNTFKAVCDPIMFTEGTPRNAVVVGDKAYVTVTNWGYGASKLVVIDLTTYAKTATYDLEGGVEGLAYANSKLWVSAGSSVVWFDINNMTNTGKVTLIEGTWQNQKIVVDKDENIWVSSSYSDYMTVAPSPNKIYKINTNSMQFDKYDVENFAYEGNISMNLNKNRVYFLTTETTVDGNSNSATSIKSFNIESPSSVEVHTTGTNFYGFAVDNSGNLFTANVNGFTINSTFQIFNGNSEIFTATVGIGACRFYLK